MEMGLRGSKDLGSSALSLIPLYLVPCLSENGVKVRVFGVHF
jgi:hypothetical protein